MEISNEEKNPDLLKMRIKYLQQQKVNFVRQADMKKYMQQEKNKTLIDKKFESIQNYEKKKSFRENLNNINRSLSREQYRKLIKNNEKDVLELIEKYDKPSNEIRNDVVKLIKRIENDNFLKEKNKNISKNINCCPNKVLCCYSKCCKKYCCNCCCNCYITYYVFFVLSLLMSLGLHVFDVGSDIFVLTDLYNKNIYFFSTSLGIIILSFLSSSILTCLGQSNPNTVAEGFLI